MSSAKGGRLETFHWSGLFSEYFIRSCSDFLLIDGTHKTNINDLSLVATTVSLGIFTPVVFLLVPSENSSSIKRHINNPK